VGVPEIRLALDSVRERALVKTVPQNPGMSLAAFQEGLSPVEFVTRRCCTWSCLLCMLH